MRRRGLLLAVMFVVAAACSGASEPTTTASSSAPSTTTAEQGGSTTTGAPPEFPTEFEPALVEQLVALESANEYTWTVDNALAAVELLRPVLETGVNAYPPIDLSRLQWFIVDNLEAMTDDQQAIVSAAPDPSQNAVLATYRAVDERVRRAWQNAAQSADNEFSRLTGSVVDGEIVVALADLPLAGGALTAGTFTGGATAANGYRWLFGSDEAFDDMKRRFDRATDGGKIEACVIVVGDVLTSSPDTNLQVAAMLHEVVHCHQHAAHPGGARAFFASPITWMDEGYASWAGEFFVGGTFKSRGWWNDYHEGIGPVGGHVTNRGGYDGIAFFSYLHDNGVDGWRNFLDYFTNVRPSGGSGPAQFESMFRRADLIGQALWAASSLQRSDLSEAWTYTTGPGIEQSSTKRTPRQTDLFVGNSTRFSLPNGEQGTYRIQPRLGGADAALLKIEISAPSIVRWPWGADQISTSELSASWCLGPECVCEDGTILGDPAPEFTESDALLAAFTGAGILVASLRTPEEECEDPPETVGQCPSGIWEASPDDTERLLLTLYRALGVADPTYEGGPIRMSFFESGTYRFDYLETAFNEDIGGDNFRIVFTGGAFGEWEATATELSVTIGGTDIQADVFINGTPAGTPRAPSSEGGGSAPYVCSGNMLLIDPEFEQPFWPYPRTWTLVEETP
ncbi:MAG: hypothetical protein GY720_12195 [bacterium]|nr:hypothetical protein [bacterium]